MANTSTDLYRIAILSVHTSPLHQPGTGDSGGMNVYIAETAKRIAARGIEVEIFTRATSLAEPEVTELAPGVLVRHIPAGPFEGLRKEDLPAQLCAVTAGVLRAEVAKNEGFYDLVHSHYWLSGQVGWIAQERWGVPLVHTMHTMARVKNLTLAQGDSPEPAIREIGEEQVVTAADRLVANTHAEAKELIELYHADPNRVRVVHPGVDLDVFVPGNQSVARKDLGVANDAIVLLFVGRIQPLKAPDVLIEAAAEILKRNPELRSRLVVAICGGPSGSGLERPDALVNLADQLGISDIVKFVPPTSRAELVKWFQAASVCVVPSYSESFGLVAIEAQACGTPVIAARVGGLPTAVRDGISGVLVDGHEASTWADQILSVVTNDALRTKLSIGAIAHASHFGWEDTTDKLISVYNEAVKSSQVRAQV
ncbi:Glycosyltransferase, family 4 [freshwater metagenome]|uniref:D-inositol-3-phosphate glycosyltransferase n=1 Tax=freshwater metagenome TaxID=449393 RepID=A0A094Q6N0_9ZZZZ